MGFLLFHTCTISSSLGSNFVSNLKSISESINKVNEQIVNHQLKWFHTWRTLYLDIELETLKKDTIILNERLRLIQLVK